MDQKIGLAEQSANMILKTTRDLTIKIRSPKKCLPEEYSKDFTREQAQAVDSIKTNFIPLNKSKNLDFTDLKVEKQCNFTIGEQTRK